MSGLLDPGDTKLIGRALNAVNDAAPGVPVSTAQVSGSIVQGYYGLVGKRLVCNTAMALKLSDTSVGTLYEGIYQYVQFKSGSTASPTRGLLAYWQDYTNYIVTPDLSATDPVLGGSNSGLVAGAILNSVSKGNYGFIQISGKATVLFKTTVTKTTPIQGDLVLADGTTSARGDVLADATNITNATAKLILGVALTTPASNTASLVDLWNLRQVIGGLGGF